MFLHVTLVLLEGMAVAMKIFALTLVFSLPLGLILAFGSMSKFKPLRYAVNTLVWIIRGTPLMLQLIIIFFGPGLWLGQNIWSGDSTGRLVATVLFLRHFPRRYPWRAYRSARSRRSFRYDAHPDFL